MTDLRIRVATTLATHIGEVLTLELARDMARQMCETPDAVLPMTPTREQIERLESLILQGPQVETPTKHHFAPGMYAREMFIPAGTVLTGAVHKTEHLSIFVGDITVWTDGGMVRLTGHHTFTSKPGAKRVGFAHADTWCTGLFPTEKTDVAELERDLVETPHLLQCNRLDFQSLKG